MVAEAGDTYGYRPGARDLSALRLNDPVLFGPATGLVEAMHSGAPNLYSQSAAAYLAVHLAGLVRMATWRMTASCPYPITGSSTP